MFLIFLLCILFINQLLCILFINPLPCILSSLLLTNCQASPSTRGCMDLMPYLVHRAKCLPTLLRVALLMPCHATPGHSHLHTPRVQLLGLDCSPPSWADAASALQADPWAGARQAMAHAGCGNSTQAACFAAQPQRVAGALFQLAAGRAVTHVALFEHTAAVLAPLLKRQGFVEERRWWHADVAVDDVPPGNLLLFRRRRVPATC